MEYSVCRVRFVMSVLALVTLFPVALAAQTATLRIMVVDSATSRPLVGATVEVRGPAGDILRTALTRRRGEVQARRLDGGDYSLVIRLVGYQPFGTSISLSSGETREVTVLLTRGALILDPLVVTANRTEELLLDVPVAMSVISAERLEQQTALTTIEYLANLPESQVLSGGLITRRYTTRGPNIGTSASVRTMTDFRYTTMPGQDINADYLVSTTVEDIGRAELLRGLATVQYGPNASRGVLNLITRSPLDDRGTSVKMAGGSQSTIQVTGRHASAVSDKVGFKISGEYFEGEDRLPATFAPDSVIGSNRLNFAQRIRVDARVDWRPDSRTQTMFSGGLAQANVFDVVTYSGLGLYIADGRMWYLQGRMRRGEFRANLFLNKLDMGNMISIHTGRTVKDFSYNARGQLQYASRIGSRTSLLYGADFGYTSGDTDSTLYGAWEGQANLTEVGGFISASTRLGSRVELVLAGRADYHSILGNASFAPWASVVYRPGPTHALRFGVSRSFTTPGVLIFYQDVVSGRLGPFPYNFRASGQSRTFRRDCGGLCMRSPYNPASAGGDQQWLPADATTQWDAAVALLQGRNIDLSGVPAPDGTQVSSRLAAAGRRGGFVPTASSDVVDFGGLTRRWTTQLEVGYKGLINNRLRVGVNAYYRQNNHLSSAFTTVTPNVFFDQASLATYLAQYMSAAQADSAAQAMAGIPMGTVSFEEATNPTDVVRAQFLVPGIDYWGASFDLEVAITPELSARANYTYLSENFLEGELGARVVFNAPQNQGVLGVDYINPRVGFNATLQGRFVESYPAVNGVTVVDLPAYTLIDAIVGYRIPGSNVTLSITAYNLFDDVHQELPFTATLGRLVIGGVRAVF